MNQQLQGFMPQGYQNPTGQEDPQNQALLQALMQRQQTQGAYGGLSDAARSIASALIQKNTQTGNNGQDFMAARMDAAGTPMPDFWQRAGKAFGMFGGAG